MISVTNSPGIGGATSRPALAWRRLADPEKSVAALNVALEVARRLREPAQIEAAVIQAKLQSDNPKGPQWVPHGFAQGYAGLALLWGQLDRCLPNEGWDAVGHEHLEIAAEGTATQGWLSSGAFSGIGGLAFAACYLSRSGTRYSRLLATLDKGLIRRLAPRIAYLNGLRDGAPSDAFDVISGLSGVVPYLLGRRESGEVETTLHDLVLSLVSLSQDENGLPRWHSPSHLSKPAEDFMLQLYPNGYLNCGLAHGIPGPLGALALAYLAGIRCAGLEEAIDRLAGWLVAHRLDDEWGLNWPNGVALRPPGDPAGRIYPMDKSTQAQAGWCYGSPGVARVLHFAGQCLERSEYCDLAVQAIEAVLRRPVAARRIESPTFCHGVAGLLQIVLRFANDTSSKALEAGAVALTEQLLGLYEPESLLGFRSVEFAGKRVDQPGLLDGAPGVALVLLGVACDTNPAWDRLFLLS
ncbi:MAG TPA: lanthionine synthetase C family protein [Candidatus Acidoferrum sp.]|jgi:hypothetical protein|nr:lanthionine synthetase C family protein [Candidatus Acidoferrum sp.]